MEPDMFKQFGRELRALKAAHKDDLLLQMRADAMIRAMRNWLATPAHSLQVERRRHIERGFMRNVRWLTERQWGAV